MMRLALAVVLLLLASAGTASAEYAWGLWEYTRRTGYKQEWRVLAALKSRPECAAEGRHASSFAACPTNDDGWEGQLGPWGVL